MAENKEWAQFKSISRFRSPRHSLKITYKYLWGASHCIRWRAWYTEFLSLTVHIWMPVASPLRICPITDRNTCFSDVSVNWRLYGTFIKGMNASSKTLTSSWISARHPEIQTPVLTRDRSSAKSLQAAGKPSLTQFERLRSASLHTRQRKMMEQQPTFQKQIYVCVQLLWWIHQYSTWWLPVTLQTEKGCGEEPKALIFPEKFLASHIKFVHDMWLAFFKMSSNFMTKTQNRQCKFQRNPIHFPRSNSPAYREHISSLLELFLPVLLLFQIESAADGEKEVHGWRELSTTQSCIHAVTCSDQNSSAALFFAGESYHDLTMNRNNIFDLYGNIITIKITWFDQL